MNARDPDRAIEADLLLADVAERYYVGDLTQEQIAREIKVSRSNVSRMLKEARERGLVEIRVHHPMRTEPDLAAELSARFSLRECLVLARAPDGVRTTDEVTARQIGALAARFLDARITAGDVVGVGWGNTVYQVVTSGYLNPKPGGDVAQMMGSMGGSTPDIDGAQVANRLGRALEATVHYLHAPMVVTDPAVREGLMRDHHIRATMAMARRATVMIVSVGAISERSGLYRAGYMDDADLEVLRGHGAAGDLCGTYYGRDGKPRDLEISGRIMAVDGDVMRGIALRVGVSWGTQKALANLGAVRSGLLNVLITDEVAARAMLRLVRDEEEPGAAGE